ncbi:uncharacterized protein YukE [Hamadaea flava]|uniref:WXG100 family type VII secretion target n=1 Tax=Hamadaea flava TaxID=1742688 RepID=A0ABV8LX91_9ACTN|nr:WXG100 family type VII secretion target [Hamadaea flava]MCP2321610.1 uncharacterized protein YukE [Hamadaea flava]
MSDYVVSVNFQAMSDLAAALRAKAATFNQQIDDANSKAGPLRDTWVQSGSQAAEKYQEYWTRLQRAAQELFADIDRLGSALGQAGQDQQANEAKFASQFE